MKCHVCGKGPLNGGEALFPADPPGTPGRRWACVKHTSKPVDREVADVVRALGGKTPKRRK